MFMLLNIELHYGRCLRRAYLVVRRPSALFTF